MRRLEFLGPDESFSFVWHGGVYSFDKGKAYDLKDEIADLCLGFNPMGVSLEQATDAGARVFKELTGKKGGGDQP